MTRIFPIALFAGLFLVNVGLKAQEILLPSWQEFGSASNQELGLREPVILDFNGDGWSDLLQFQKINGVGNYRMLAGSPQGFTANAFVWEVPAGHFLTFDGTTGDFNGDGFDDLVLADKTYDDSKGALEVYYGNTGFNIQAPVLIASPVPSALGYFGSHFDGGGDVNGDGFSDLIVTAPGQGNFQASQGRAYCFYGSANGLLANAFTAIIPEHIFQKFALNVRHIGDYNQDGYGDAIIHTGADALLQEFVEIYIGSPTGLLTDTSYIVGDGIINEAYAWNLGKAGDLNGDGFDDFFVAIPQHYSSLGPSGKLEIHYGTDNFNTPIESAVFALPGIASDNWGWSVATAGDFNGDGFSDLALRDGGHFYIYKGSPGELEELPDYDFPLGNYNRPSVTACGDINQDGFGDVLAYSNTVKEGDLNWGAGWQALFYGLSDTRPAFSSEASGCLPDNLFHFQNLTTGPPATGWLWDFGDGTTSTEESPSHHYATAAWYTVKLTATTSTGQFITLQKDSAVVVYEPLAAGTYTVGGPSANFPTLTALNRHLPCGITGDVTIQIKNGTYQDSLSLLQVPTNGFTLTVESESGIRDSVFIQKRIHVQGTDNLVLRNLSAWHNSGVYSVKIKDCKNLRLEGCAMYSLDYNSFSTHALRASGVDGLTIQQCYFDNQLLPTEYDNGFTMAAIDSSKSVWFKENEATENFLNWSFASPGLWLSASNSEGVRVEENDILGMNVYCFEVDTLSVLSNIMEGGSVKVDTGHFAAIQHNRTSGGGEAIRLNNVTGFRVVGNKVDNSDGGIILTGSTGIAQGQFDLVANNAVGGEIGLAGNYSDYFQHGIGLLLSKHVKVYHNSVLFDRPSYINSYNWGAALHVIECDSVDVRNNVFKNPTSTGGYDGGVVYLGGNTNYTSDYNAFDGLGFTHPLPSHLFGWDLHSLFVPVQFAGQLDLQLDAANPLLNRAAPALPEVTLDYDGNARPTDFVDIGAFEFDAPSVSNIQAALILTDTLIVGQNTISLRVTNQRPVAEDAIYLSYQYNNRPPVTELWTGNLGGFGQLDFDFSTPLALDKGLLSKLKLWVSLPADADVYPKNDTLRRSYYLPMLGTYTVGDQPGTDFKGMAEANTSLDSLDLLGDVVIELLPGVYSLPSYSFKNWDSFDDAHHITYQSATGNPEDAEWAFGWVHLSKNLIFKDLTIRPISSGGFLFQEEGIEIYESRDILFNNCRFVGNPDDLTNRQAATVFDCKNIEWNGCVFEGLKRGVFFADYSNFGGAGYMEGKAKVANCEFRGSMEYGVRLNSLPLNQLDFEVIGCKMEDMTDGVILNTTAIFFTAPFSAKIIGNDISTSYRTINVSVPNHAINLLIANNFLAEEFGVYLYNPTGTVEMAHNSFSPKGIMCVQAENPGQLKLYNNSFDERVQSTYLSPLVFMHGGSYEGDHNNFHQPNPSLPVFEYLNTYCNTLADLQALTGQEPNSISQPPHYAAPNDMHLLPNSPLIEAALPLPTVPTDHDGEPRDATTPDIGADEYQPCYVTDTAPTMLSGHVSTSGGSSPLANSAIELIGFDQANGNVSVLDATTTDANGFYQFTTAAPTVYLRAVPDAVAYPNQLPTYFGNSVAIQGATCIPLDSANVTANFSSIQNFNAGGSGSIIGQVDEGPGFVAGDPVAGLPVILMDEALNPIAWALTDNDGIFQMDNLPFGKYSFWVDKAWVSNALAPIFTLQGDSANLAFELNSFYLDLIESLLPQPTLTIVQVQPAFCYGSGYYGSATASASGGTPPYQYHWDNGLTEAVNNVLLVGVHSVTVTDANGQVDTTIFEVGVQQAIIANPTVQDATCATCTDGAVSLSPSGGTGPYVALWNGGLPAGLTHTNLLPGTYSYQVFDVVGCQADSSLVVGFPDFVNWRAATPISVYPNPTTGQFRFDTGGEVSCNWQLFDSFGKQKMAGKGIVVDASQLPAAIYWLKVELWKKEYWARIIKIL